LGLLVALAVVRLGAVVNGGGATELVTQGIGSEAENDAALISALGKKDGDTAKDVKEATEEAVKKAQEETEEAVAAEIDEAVTKGETEGKGNPVPNDHHTNPFSLFFPFPFLAFLCVRLKRAVTRLERAKTGHPPRCGKS